MRAFSFLLQRFHATVLVFQCMYQHTLSGRAGKENQHCTLLVNTRAVLSYIEMLQHRLCAVTVKQENRGKRSWLCGMSPENHTADYWKYWYKESLNLEGIFKRT